MKQISLLLSCILLLIAGCTNKNNEPKATITNAIFFKETPTISAHRAGKGLPYYPENCLETMQYLYGKGIKSFEIDIFASSDGHLLLLHDDHLGRTCTGSGKASKKTRNQLEKETLIDDFGNRTSFHIPTLQSVLKWAKDKEDLTLMIDFKKGISYEKTIQLIRQEQAQNKVVLISYTNDQAQKLHSIAPDMLLSVSARNEEELQRVLALQIPNEKLVAFTGTMLSDKKLYQQLSELRIPAILGTLGNLDKRAEARGNHLYNEWAKLGIQIFSTDRPLAPTF